MVSCPFCTGPASKPITSGPHQLPSPLSPPAPKVLAALTRMRQELGGDTPHVAILPGRGRKASKDTSFSFGGASPSFGARLSRPPGSGAAAMGAASLARAGIVVGGASSARSGSWGAGHGPGHPWGGRGETQPHHASASGGSCPARTEAPQVTETAVEAGRARSTTSSSSSSSSGRKGSGSGSGEQPGMVISRPEQLQGDDAGHGTARRRAPLLGGGGSGGNLNGGGGGGGAHRAALRSALAQRHMRRLGLRTVGGGSGSGVELMVRTLPSLAEGEGEGEGDRERDGEASCERASREVEGVGNGYGRLR